MTSISIGLPLLVGLVLLVARYSFAELNKGQSPPWRLTSPEGSYVRAVAGFGTELECYVETCLPKELTVKWYKDGKLVAEGTEVEGFDGRGHIRHGVTLDHTKDCNGTCSAMGPYCPRGHYCLDNSCCACDNEEYTLVLSNLTYDDAGTYVCKVEGGNELEFDLEILEYGLMPSRRTYTFDHSACCAAEGVSPKCMPLCKPSTIEQHKFDPVACEDEYEKLLKCVTEGGNVSHVHCCRINFVPAFCWEFCHGQFSEPKRSNQFCIYWMPEIFDCYERAYLPFPGPPEKLVVNPLNSSALLACWQPPRVRVDSVLYYTVRYQEVPRFPFLGGGIPFLTGEAEDPENTAIPTVESNPFQTSGVTDEFPSHAMPHERRKKRQSLLIMTHNLLTNETDVREYKFSEINTTDTCVVIDNLKASTQYLVFATAVNSYGTSLPTSKQTASTEAVIYPNHTLPDVLGCCKRNFVSPECVSKLCDLNDVPSAFGAFSVALTCRSEFAQVAPCLADGRNHSVCCKDRGVGGECLKLCDGTASDLGLTSVLCLSLDMHAVYSCLREGYVTHPSPPTNVTVSVTGPQSAYVMWDPPINNAYHVRSYSLFVHEGKDKSYEITNAVSPYELVDLEANSIVRVYLLAHTDHGSSLKSTVVEFFTGVKEFNFCEQGTPMRGVTGELMKCFKQIDCPAYTVCTGVSQDDFGGYCCPTAEFLDRDFKPNIPDLPGCCSSRGVRPNCLSLCSYSITVQEFADFREQCVQDLKAIVECAGDGRDHRPCCIEAEVPDPCLDFCYSPVKYIGSHHMTCLKHVVSIAKCSLHGILKLPGTPLNLRVSLEGPRSAKFTWDAPTQDIPVEYYELLLTQEESNSYKEYNTTERSYTVTSLQPSVEYLAVVIAWNKHGSSVPGNHVTFTTQSDGSEIKTDDRPLPPHSLQKVWYHDRAVNITWEWAGMSYTSRPVKNYRFKVVYRVDGAREWQQVEANSTYVVLKNLTPLTAYDVYAVAVDLDRNLSSFPSEIVEIFTWEVAELPEVTFSTSPHPPFREGNTVTVTCTVLSGALHNLTIEWGGRQVAFGRDKASFVIQNIKREDVMKTLMCIGYSPSGEAVKVRHFLNVHFAPIVMTSIFPVFAYSGFKAELVCRVHAYPMMQTKWYFAKNWSHVQEPLVDDSRYLFFISSHDNPFSFNATALIKKTTLADSGLYTCNCCNELGCTNASVSLHVEQFPAPRGPGTLLSCCQEKQVLQECLSACTVDIDVSVYVNNPHCMKEFPKLLQCAKDGIDHGQCCVMAGVPSHCLAYCHQADDLPLNLDCLNYTTQILYCVQEGHRKAVYILLESIGALSRRMLIGVLPSAPMNVSVHPVVGQRALNVTWVDPPMNKKMHTTYIVYYQEEGSDRIEKVRTENTFAILTDLNASATYTISMVAANHNGFSSFGPVIQYSSAALANWDHSAYEEGGTSSAGIVFAVFFCLFIAFAVVLSIIYFTRKPYHLPAFILKLKKRPAGDQPSSAVAFENPGYEREGQVRVLPANGYTAEPPAEDPTSGWDRPELEAIREPQQREQDGMRYTRFR
ncbi:carboxypeptidase e [Trichuris trichiura]|uniref:Carboxypeptidase e n=1 Tax=Trichuris trichiura TaxID=36087 RepID=A0A077Z8Q4_TRITR|nr:carboxypeptidase e [Trichuris trichiura]